MKRKNFFITLFLILTCFFFIQFSPAEAITDNQIKATVQIVCKDTYSGNWYSGSGTIIDPSGIVLTNRHVIMGDNNTAIKNCLIGFVDNPSQEPDFQYMAETKYWTTTSDKDAAILYIDNKTNKLFSYVDIFNSDSNSLQFGDKIEVVGYPSIGGSTLTYTEGVFSGVGSSKDKTQNYIKTTASLGHGNSGGGAYSSGKFMGIPTMVVSDIDIANSVGYILSINNIKTWLSGTLGDGYENKVTEYKPTIKDNDVFNKQIDNTPPDISKTIITASDSGYFIFDPNSIYEPSGIKGYYMYFGENVNAEPEIDGKFTTYHGFNLKPLDDVVYYFILKAIDKYDNISNKLIYKYKRISSDIKPIMKSVRTIDTDQYFMLNDGDFAILPGGKGYELTWSYSPKENFKSFMVDFNDGGPFHLENAIEVEENKINTRVMRNNFCHALGVAIKDKSGHISPFTHVLAISTLPKGADYQKYLLSPEIKNLNLKLDGSLIKTVNGQGIYLIENGNKRPIKSAKIFLAKGYKWGDVVIISQEEMDSYPLGTDLTIDENNKNKEIPSEQKPAGTLSNGALVRAKGTDGVYLIHNNQKRPIKSATIFLGRGYKWGDVVDVEQSVLDVYPRGSDVTILEDIDIERETNLSIKINVPRLRVRSLPSLNGKIITLVPEGESYDVIVEQNGWYEIYYNPSKTGWVMSKYTIKE